MSSAPFLSIVTRCSKRPRSLLRAVRSVTDQTDLDAEHIFLVDKKHRGLKFANQQFWRYRNVPRGRYVWLLDDDDMINEPDFIKRVKVTADETDADVIVVKRIHEHSGLVHPQPEIWNLDWEGGKRPRFWAGGGSCVVVKREIWKQNLKSYFDGQGKKWNTGGDWHFITSLIEDKTLHFARCDVVAGRQPDRGYGNKTERCSADWFERISEKLNLEHVERNAYRIDYRERIPSWIEIPNVSIKQPLHILQCAQWDWAGCAAMLSEAINEHTIHICRAIRWKEDGSFGFPSDVVAPSDDELSNLWKWADVIHIHDSAPVKRLRPKPTVITMHGSKYRKSPAKYQRIISQRGWYLTVATPDLTEIHGAPWMPDTRTGLPERTATFDGFVALHCPSIRANKGTKHVIEQMKRIPMIDFRLIEDVSWHECLRIKASLSKGVLIDQFEWGYGCNAIEAWAYGIPVISNAIGASRRAFQELFGYFPFLVTQPTGIADAVLSLTDPRQYERIRDIGVGHYKRYHEPSATAAIAVEFYDCVLSSQSNRISHAISDAPLGADGLTLIRYLGRNYGTTTWFGPVTGTEYHFSAADRLKYVDDRDVPGLLNIERHTNRMFEVVD